MQSTINGKPTLANRITTLGVAAMLCCIITPNALADNDKDKDKHKLKFEVLENTSLNDCLYIGDVVLDVRYKLHQIDSGELNVELSDDGQTYVNVLSQPLDGRKGSVLLSFNAGECAKDVRLSVL
jgi:hypothetical protein